jgi:hypothetical protein
VTEQSPRERVESRTREAVASSPLVVGIKDDKAPLLGVPLLTHHLRQAMLRSDQARDVAVSLTSLDFETRARLAHVILMGRDAEAMRAAAEQRITELEAEVAAAESKAETLQQDWNALQDLLGRRS